MVVTQFVLVATTSSDFSDELKPRQMKQACLDVNDALRRMQLELVDSTGSSPTSRGESATTRMKFRRVRHRPRPSKNFSSLRLFPRPVPVCGERYE